MTVTQSRQSLAKLAEEAKKLYQWTTVRDWAAQIYGEGKAAKIDIDTYGEYNDEGGTDYSIESLRVTDAEDEDLEPDFSLPFFQTKSWKRYHNGDKELDDDDFLEMLRYLCLTKEERAIFVDFDALPAEDSIYDLTTPPLLTLPTQEDML